MTIQSADITLPTRISHLALTWVLVVPIVYFASRGHFWFEDSADNQVLLNLSGINAVATSNEASLIGLAIISVICFLLCGKVQQMIDTCLKERVFAILSLLALISCVWSQFPVLSLKWSICIVVNTLFAFYLYRRFTPAQQMKLVYLLGWICLALSISFALIFPKHGLDTATGSGAWRGIYGYKNACAMPTVFFLSVSFFLELSSFLFKVLRAAYIILSIILIVMSQSRTGWILLAFLVVYIIAMKIVQTFAWTDRRIVMAVVTIVLSSSVCLLMYYSSGIFYLVGKDPTLSGRTDIWKAIVVSALKRPILGYGYMAFFNGIKGENANAGLSVQWGGLSASHNGFLDVWVSLGFVGVGLIVYTFYRAFKNAIVCLCGVRSPYLVWCSCVVVLMLVVNLDEKAMMVPNDLIWILYVLACLALYEGAANILKPRLNHA